MSRTVVVKDVPADSVDQVVADFEADHAEVTTTPQGDGKFTVTAIFPGD